MPRLSIMNGLEGKRLTKFEMGYRFHNRAIYRIIS